MVLRKRLIASLSTGLLPLLSVSFSHALVIQPVQVKSALGEPFYAEIAISDLGTVSLSDISIDMANAQELADLGVTAGSFQGSLNFSVQNQSNGRGVIVVRSKQPINEPFMDFVLRIKNGQNTRLKKINALIDPPISNKKVVNLQPLAASATELNLASSNTAVFEVNSASSENIANEASERQLSVINAPPPDMTVKAQSNTNTKQTSISSNKNTTPAEIEVSTAAKNKTTNHTVRNNESLWKIAKQLEPELKQPVGQIMQRIRDMNKDAFIAGDPNQLRRGATLVLPEDTRKATLVAAPQTTATKKPLSNKPITTTQAPLNRSGRLPKAELTLVAPTVQGSAHGNSDKGQNVGSQPLSREIVLKVGQERRKTVLMQHEVTELDAQLALNDKKIAMLNAKLAELEHQLKMRNQAKKQPVQKQPMQAVPPKKAANAILPIVAFASIALFGLSPNMAHAADGDGGFPIWLIPVALLIIAIIVKVVQGKSTDKKPAARGKAKRPVRKPSTSPRQEQPAARPVTPTAQSSAPVAVARPAAQPEADVLQEVQSYIERDRFTQAVGLLKDAVAKQPERVDIQVKLLEVLALQNDIDGFEHQFNVVNSFNQPEISAHAEKMRALLQPKANDDLDSLDLSLDFTPSKPQPSSNVMEFDAGTASTDVLNDLDLPASSNDDQSLAELEAEFGFTQELATSPTSAPSKLDSIDNTFDISLDDLETSTQLQPQNNQADLAPLVDVAKDQPVDLEFDLSDSFNLEEVESPTTFEFDLDEPKPSTQIAAEPAKPAINLNELSVEDTNWADGFDDQDFNIGADVSTAQTAAATPAAESGTNASDFLSKEFPFLVNLDVQQTNLELAESYINLGERSSARELLDEVISQGNPQQQAQAQHLMQKLVS